MYKYKNMNVIILFSESFIIGELRFNLSEIELSLFPRRTILKFPDLTVFENSKVKLFRHIGKFTDCYFFCVFA